MANYIAIDGGTTNTRIILVCDYKIKDAVKCSIGAAVGCNNKELIKNTLEDEIQKILKKNNMQESDIKRILASGMITSEGGLCNLEHLVAPCGMDELAKGLYETTIPDVSSIPFVFARGIKTAATSFAEIDMMRGEETELMGIAEKVESDCLYVLPGSHSKLINTDDAGRICDFSTELTGEIISAVSGNTILKNSVSLDTSEINEEYLQMGYTFAKERGINAAFFKVRILDKLLSDKEQEVFSFFIGATLESEIENIIKSHVKKVMICGKRELKIPTAILLRKNSDKEVVEVEDDLTEYAAAYGVIHLFEHFDRIIKG